MTLAIATRRNQELAEIREKVLANERLDLDDGIALLECDDLLSLGELADTARRLRGGTDEVYFVNNLYLNHTTICRVKCKFCAFARTSKQDGAILWDIDDLVAHAVEVRERQDYTEIHMVGGENPHLDFSYYVDVTRALRTALPDVHLKLFTASEIHHMTKLSGLTHGEVLRELHAAGLDTLPGGGAEVFSPRVRKIIAPGKEPAEHWLETHRLAHGMGMRTHCTMLYNHVETYEERVEHLLALRDLQDETGGFMAFIPLPFHPQNTVFERRGWTFTTGMDDLKMIAVSRLMLDNVEHVKAYWIMISTPLAQVALHFGANDIQGTVVEEMIAHAAGAVTPTEEKVQTLARVIREAGRVPVQRDTFYHELRRFDGEAA
jgi:aminodeoxyfutalosine synthase